MRMRTLFTTDQDFSRLAQLIECALRFQPASHQHLIGLKEELDAARVVTQEEIPPDVVSLDSEVRVRDVETGEAAVHRIVFPREAYGAEDRLSVLAPLGTALLGCRAGDIVALPGKRLQVEQVIRQSQAASMAA